MAPTPTHGDHRLQFSILKDRLQRLLAVSWLPRIVNVGVAIVCTSVLAFWTWDWIEPGPQLVAQAQAAPAPPAKSFDIEALLAAQLFGQAPQAQELMVETLPVSSLNLVLSGVVAASEGGLALIKVDDQPEAPFSVGQEVVDGAVLQAVYADRIVISRGGASESVLLKDSDAAALPLAKPPQTARPAAGAKPRKTGASAAPRVTGLLHAGSVSPHAGGGLAVNTVRSNGFYQRAGMRAGDVIRSANGIAMNSMADVWRVYQQSGGRPLRLDIVRDGKPQTVTINLE